MVRQAMVGATGRVRVVAAALAALVLAKPGLARAVDRPALVVLEQNVRSGEIQGAHSSS
jgi:hypothetical protein